MEKVLENDIIPFTCPMAHLYRQADLIGTEN